jgi:hypothetical protein
MRRLITYLMLVAAALLLPAAPAASQDEIWTHTINNETNGVWHVMPDRPRPRTVGAPDHLGGAALRVRGRASSDPWAVQAQSPTGGQINQGDVIMVVYYARAEQAAEGGSVLPALVQLADAPYTSALTWNERITGEWSEYCEHGVASATMPAGHANVSIHLATANQVIDLGPVFVFNFGPDFDPANLPRCDG